MQKQREITKYKQIITEHPKGEIPFKYHERIIGILCKCLPDIESRVHKLDKYIRVGRVFGITVINDLKENPKIRLESRNGVIVKAWVNTVIEDSNGSIAGQVNRSILNDGVQFRNDKKQTKEESHEIQTD